MGESPTVNFEKKEENEDSESSRSGSTKPEDPERGQWTGKFDFLMSMIAYAVGLGNVWRFPYLCYRNGGGTFLVAYSVFFVTAAVPIFTMEVTIGQYLQKGAMEIWRQCPLFKGVGIGNVVIAFMCIAYFCVIVAWSTFYLICSFRSEFPWETCNNEWNDHRCVTGKNESEIYRINQLAIAEGFKTQSSVEQFWERRVLRDTGDIGNFGGIQWELFFILLGSWIVVYFSLWKGITHAKKFVYFCALFPYVLILILLIRGLTLPGASTGIYYYLKPNISRLADIAVWKDAGTQVFYSYGVGFGTLIALGSHNKYNHNCFRDGILMCFINGGTSIVAGFAVFSILGYMSLIGGKEIEDIVEPGVGLAFLVYPEVASNMQMKQLFSVMFFLMIIMLGLDSQICMLEGLYTALEDAFPILRKHRRLSLAITCAIFFAIGIPMVTHSGAYWLTLFDTYGASGYALLFVVFFEVVGLAYVFGANRIRHALREMIGISLPRWFNYVWQVCSPGVCVILFILCVVYYEPIKYPTGKPFPLWANIMGWLLSSCSMVVIPGYAIYYLFCTNSDCTIMEKIRLGLNLDGTFESGWKTSKSESIKETEDASESV